MATKAIPRNCGKSHLFIVVHTPGHCLLRNGATSGDEQSEGWTYGRREGVLRYRKGTPDLCVRYSKDVTLHWHSDASHSRSVPGYLYMFAGGPVTWSSKKQPMVALSSCESEYIALTHAGQEAVYLSELLSEWMFLQFSSVQMYEDNIGALQLTGTTTFSSRT